MPAATTSIDFNTFGVDAYRQTDQYAQAMSAIQEMSDNLQNMGLPPSDAKEIVSDTLEVFVAKLPPYMRTFARRCNEVVLKDTFQ